MFFFSLDYICIIMFTKRRFPEVFFTLAFAKDMNHRLTTRLRRKVYIKLNYLKARLSSLHKNNKAEINVCFREFHGIAINDISVDVRRTPME